MLVDVLTKKHVTVETGSVGIAGAADINAVKRSIFTKKPIAADLPVYSSWKPGKTIPLPGSRDKFRGFHAVMIYGYDDATREFLVKNSWGKKGGKQRISYDYVGTYARSLFSVGK